MRNSDQTGTNATDSAPGVDDGPRGAGTHGGGPKRGAGKVWLWVGIALAILVVVFIARPWPESGAPPSPAPPSPAPPPETAGQATVLPEQAGQPPGGAPEAIPSR